MKEFNKDIQLKVAMRTMIASLLKAKLPPKAALCAKRAVRPEARLPLDFFGERVKYIYMKFELLVKRNFGTSCIF